MYFTRYTRPRLTGVIIREAVKCGKPNCHCAEGELHQGYYYLYYRQFSSDSWKLKKEYVPRSEVDGLIKEIREIKERENKLKRGFTKNAALLMATRDCLKGKSSVGDYLGALNEIAGPN